MMSSSPGPCGAPVNWARRVWMSRRTSSISRSRSSMQGLRKVSTMTYLLLIYAVAHPSMAPPEGDVCLPRAYRSEQDQLHDGEDQDGCHDPADEIDHRLPIHRALQPSERFLASRPRRVNTTRLGKVSARGNSETGAAPARRGPTSAFAQRPNEHKDRDGGR
jgi:hypothetical protein